MLIDRESKKKMVYESSYLTTLNQFFACRVVILGLPKFDIKARYMLHE